MVKVSPVIQTVLRPCRGCPFFNMKLKRGAVREDGMVFLKRDNGTEIWISRESFDIRINKERDRFQKKLNELKQKDKTFKRGDVRADGMIFWAYQASCKNGEKWITKGQFLKLKKDYKVIVKKLKRGNIRKDGKVFFGYRTGCLNSEFWLTKEKFIKYVEKERQIGIKRRKIDSYKIYQNEYERKKRSNDILFRLSRSIRTRIAVSIKNKNLQKNNKTTQILGCTIPDFKTHIESQFLPGMTWENRSQWHIDHIMPVSMAKTYDEVVRLNHYKNLRPMWASDNLRKSDKIGDTLVLF